MIFTRVFSLFSKQEVELESRNNHVTRETFFFASRNGESSYCCCRFFWRIQFLILLARFKNDTQKRTNENILQLFSSPSHSYKQFNFSPVFTIVSFCPALKFHALRICCVFFAFSEFFPCFCVLPETFAKLILCLMCLHFFLLFLLLRSRSATSSSAE